MKKFIDFIKKVMEVFQNMDGSTSSRRTIGIALIVVAIVGFFTKRETELVLSFLGTGWSAISVTTFDPHPPVAVDTSSPVKSDEQGIPS